MSWISREGRVLRPFDPSRLVAGVPHPVWVRGSAFKPGLHDDSIAHGYVVQCLTRSYVLLSEADMRRTFLGWDDSPDDLDTLPPGYVAAPFSAGFLRSCAGDTHFCARVPGCPKRDGRK